MLLFGKFITSQTKQCLDQQNLFKAKLSYINMFFLSTFLEALSEFIYIIQKHLKTFRKKKMQ